MYFEHEDSFSSGLETTQHTISDCSIKNCCWETFLFERIGVSKSPSGTGIHLRAVSESRWTDKDPIRSGPETGLYSHSVMIQVCYHPPLIGVTLSSVDRDTGEREDKQIGRQVNCAPKFSIDQGHRKQDESSAVAPSSLSPQERIQYDWYSQAYLKAHLTRDPRGEREYP